MAVTRTHFAFRIDMWTADGESVAEHMYLRVLTSGASARRSPRRRQGRGCFCESRKVEPHISVMWLAVLCLAGERRTGDSASVQHFTAHSREKRDAIL